MPNHGAIASLLGRTPLFRSLDEADRLEIAEKMRPASFAAGQLIFARGDPAKHVYLVLEGQVRISVLSIDGRILSFNHTRAGEIFGEIAVIDGGSRSADATALTRVETMALSRTQFHHLIDTNPRVARAGLSFLCQRLRDASDRSETIALYPVEVRVARFLLSALKLRDPSGKADGIPLKLGMSQGELALLVGACRQKVNVALSMLEDTGAIERKGSTIACHASELARIAEMDERVN
jgi:CRP/FNR family transcriptional regulator, cyclic AMP receptor protein